MSTIKNFISDAFAGIVALGFVATPFLVLATLINQLELAEQVAGNEKILKELAEQASKKSSNRG